jgi:LPXTG-motif cell wall-anchored protein
MKLLRIALIVPVIAVSLGLSVAAAQPASAATTTCDAVAVGTKNTAGNTDSRFVVNSNGTVSATFEVKGDATCQVAVSMAAWTAPDATHGRPYDQQKMFDHATSTFGVGRHTLTVKLPNCFYQIDLARGANPTGPNGSAVYEAGRLMGSLHGGTKVCETPTPPTTPPTTPQPPVTPVTPVAPTPEVLPNTGAGSTAAIAAVVAVIAGTAYHYVRRSRRSYNQ